MKKLAVYGHCTIDQIQLGPDTYEQIGGSACYAAVTARRFGFAARMITRFGPDFPRQYLDDRGIDYMDSALSDLKTTRFVLTITGAERTIYQKCACEPIEHEDVTGADCTILSPLCGEITEETYARIKNGADNFLLVDPQGFLRVRSSERGGGNGNGKKITLRSASLDLTNVQAIKVSSEEAYHLTDGASGEKAMTMLQKHGAQNVIYTDKTDISLLNSDKIYTLTLPNKKIYDTTGIGDIFCAAFCCTMIKERDILWALCFAGGAAQAALDSKDVGLQKIPRKNQIQTNASYFYNMIKFKTL